MASLEQPALPPIQQRVVPKLDWKNATIKDYKDKVFKGSKEESVERCVNLLEHTRECKDPNSCKEGEGCRKTRIVESHYRSCTRFLMGQPCAVCHQFLALCHIHELQFKNEKFSCYLPTFGVKYLADKTNLQSGKEELEELTRKLVVALQMPTLVEKKQEILKLFNSYPQQAAAILKDRFNRQSQTISNKSNHSLHRRIQFHNMFKRATVIKPNVWRAKVLCKTLC